MNYSLKIGWLYPELMSTYGDRGNIIVLQKRCEWRGIEVEVKRLDVGFDAKLLALCHLLFMGGAQDRQQTIVAKDLKEKRGVLSEMIEDEIPGLYICGAYQFLGKYYKEADGTIIDGLGILDLYTENPGENIERLIGNIIVDNLVGLGHETYEVGIKTLVGFENHGGRTYLGEKVKPLGKVLKGYGNNGNLPAMLDGRQVQAGDGYEGAWHKNSFGSYMHGPILPKNPHFADYLIKLSLEKKCGEKIELKKLDDELELKAHKAILQRIS